MTNDRLKTLVEFQPHGHYHLAGHCNGALLAIGMIQRSEKGKALVLISPGLAALLTPVVNLAPVAGISPPALKQVGSSGSSAIHRGPWH